MRPHFAADHAVIRPRQSCGRVFVSIPISQKIARLWLSPQPRGKDIAMTYDPEKYRASLAHRNLPKDQEDATLDDLWSISQTLVDRAIARRYPHLSAQSVLLSDPLAHPNQVDCDHSPQTKETP
ncbi:hypothetical protein RLO149_c018920 [Roseobacter litoralis Och 149]|uniref:Uncharacterized protein n=1 Tax=Roseobacter litoralis (strain ATCC 49566 / DSM 6996 / JCM 21268 / NBRC 15278 / OCh 149) TaxID=391595 RepID=F7ZJP9_ROSLO|nr:hypothetical protein RLO149_c018920 [Roseobacter litoralis Och 149]